MKSRNWCFTVQGDIDTVDKSLKDWETMKRLSESAVKDGKIIYIQFQIEKASRFHIQGFVCYENAVSMSYIRKYLTGNGHLEKMNGSVKDNIEYCSKEQTKVEGTEWNWGTPPINQGQRNDLTALSDFIKTNPDEKEVFETYPKMYLMYNKSIKTALSFYTNTRTGALDTDVQVYFGKPGTGKTRKAFELTAHTNMYIKDDTQWWDGYNGQEYVLFDDFSGEIPYRQFIRILDRYPMQVQVKGGYENLSTLKFIITSNKHPRDWYPDVHDENIEFWQSGTATPLSRRIKTIIEIV